jgi:SAM-dependent methyltransferase
VSDLAAHPYDRHVGRYGSQLAAGLIEAAGIRGGDRVLDVGCGTGQLTQALAATVGAENVAAIDPSAGVVEVCRARVPTADVRVASAEDLPFEDAEFDAVLAQLVVNLVDDPPGAVTEMARVARPGAPVAACVWDDYEMPLLRSFWEAARTAAPDELAEVNEQAQLGPSDLGLLHRWWEAAGLEDIAVRSFFVAADYASFDDLWFSFESGVGHSGALYTSLSPEQRSSLRAEAYRRLGSPDGAFNLEAKAHIVRGTRSGGQ